MLRRARGINYTYGLVRVGGVLPLLPLHGAQCLLPELSLQLLSAAVGCPSSPVIALVTRVLPKKRKLNYHQSPGKKNNPEIIIILIELELTLI